MAASFTASCNSADKKPAPPETADEGWYKIAAFKGMYENPPTVEVEKTFTAEQRKALVARGKYLVNAAACSACHAQESPIDKAPLGKAVDRTDLPLAGGKLMHDRFGEVRAANITPDPESGIGGWKTADIEKALRSSLAKDGRALSLDLHSSYRWMSNADAEAIGIYLLSSRPVSAHVERRELGVFDRKKLGLISRYSEVQGFVPAPNKTNPAAYGRYLSYHVSGCYSCHTSEGGLLEQSVPFAGGEGRKKSLMESVKLLYGSLKDLGNSEAKEQESIKGLLSEEGRREVFGEEKAGDTNSHLSYATETSAEEQRRELTEGQFPVLGPDIRGSSAAGLLAWSTEDIKNYLSSGRTPNGKIADSRICPWTDFSKMTDADKQAIAVFIKQQ